MAHKEHPDFAEPGRNATIWRYMDLSKFLYLLDRSELYFSRLDHLSDIDSFEGYYNAANLLIEESEDSLRGIGSTLKRLREFVEENRAVTFANCWHLQDHESAAMWIQYLKSEEGIAIQSTYSRLVDSMSEFEEYEVYIGAIKYIDYETEPIPYRNLLYPFMHKRRSFEHERELRALIWTLQHGKNKSRPEANKYKDVLGINVRVDLEVLIERIYLAPTAPAWLHEIMSSLVGKYGVQRAVARSDLASAPMY